MTKRQTEARRVFRMELARMVQEFRNWHEAPHILIGKAALVLLERGEPVTIEAIRDCVTALHDERDADMIRRTLALLDQGETAD